MDEDKKVLQQERTKLYEDFWNNKIPKRLPISMKISTQIIAAMGGINPLESQYNTALLCKPAEELCDKLYVDACPISGSRSGLQTQIFDCQTWVMAENGYIQHPEVSAMSDTEYQDLIKDPFAFIYERVLPRHFKSLDLNDGFAGLENYVIGNAIQAKDSSPLAKTTAKMNEKHGYYKGAPKGSVGFTAAPYDYLADQLRSFSGMSVDIRRRRSEILDACEAIYPVCFNLGLPDNIDPQGCVTTPLHMPMFMREKDFVEVWLPTYKRMCEEYAALGARMSMFLESDWERYYDILCDQIPAGEYLRLEIADPKLAKEKLGGKFFIGLLYPLNYIRYKTKQECIDKAKEICDIMMPGGGWMYGYDKLPLMANDINFENLCAVHEFVRDYAVYDNPGESFGQKLNSENFDFDSSRIIPIKSKYTFDLDKLSKKYPFMPEEATSRVIKEQNAFMRSICKMFT